MTRDLTFSKPLLLRETSAQIQDFDDYLKQNGGEIRRDCPFLRYLMISEPQMLTPTSPPSIVNLGRECLTAKCLRYDFETHPDEAMATVSGDHDKAVASHYLEALSGETHLSQIHTSMTSRLYQFTVTVQYQKLIRKVNFDGMPFIA